MNVNNIYKWLFGLLTTSDSSMSGSDISAMTPTASRAERRELLLIAKKEDCLPNLYQEWEMAGLLSPSESADQALLKRRQASALQVARDLPAGVVLLTGASLQRHYPPRTPRFSQDVDVLVADFNAVGPIHDALEPLGYLMQEAGQWHVPLRGPLQKGFASYRYWSASSYENAQAVQVHVAGLPVAPQRNLPHAVIAEKAVRLDGHACLGLEPTRQLLVSIADFCSRTEPITVRHLADVHHVLRAGGNAIDYAWLHRRIEEWDLWGGLAKLHEAIAARRLQTAIQWGKLTELINASGPRMARQAQATAKPAEPRKGRTPSPLVQRSAALVKAVFDLFGEPRGDDWSGRIARSPALVALVLRAGHRVHAVPVSSRATVPPRVLRIGDALYLASGAGLFLLSLADVSRGCRADIFNRNRHGKSVVISRWSGTARPRSASR